MINLKLVSKFIKDVFLGDYNVLEENHLKIGLQLNLKVLGRYEIESSESENVLWCTVHEGGLKTKVLLWYSTVNTGRSLSLSG